MIEAVSRIAPLVRVLRSRRFLGVAAALLAAYTAFGFLLVPRLVAGLVRSQVEQRWHRAAAVGEVRFNPFTLELELRDLAVPDADGGPLLGVKRLYLNLQLASLFLLAPDFKAIALDEPRIRLVRRPDGRLNLQDFVPPPDPQADPNAPPPRLYVGELAVRGGELRYGDRKTAPAVEFELKPVGFTLRAFSTRSEGNAYTLSATSSRGEILEWHGSFGLAPVVSSGRYALTKVRAETLIELIGAALPVELQSGELNLHGSYEFAERGATLALTANIEELALSELRLRVAGDDANSLAVPKITLSDVRFDLAQQSVSVAHLSISEPQLKATRAHDGTLPLAKLAPTTAPAAHAPPAAPAVPGARPWTVAVPDIRLSGGSLEIEDQVPARPAVMRVASIELAVGGFARPIKAPVQIDLHADVNGTGHVAVQGPLALEPLAGTLTVEAGALGLTALQPYVDALAALKVTSGTASLKAAVTLKAGGAIALEGDASVDDLATVDSTLGEDFIKWHGLKLRGLRAQTAPFAVNIREIIADRPYARLIIGPNRVTNVHAILAPPGEAPPVDATPAPAPAAPAAPTSGSTATGATPTADAPTVAATAGARSAPPLPLSIGAVRIVGGSLNFSDLSIKPAFNAGIQELAGTIKGLSARPDSRADVQLDGKVDRYAPVSITGKVNVFAAEKHSDVTMSFHNLELTGLSPYAGKFAGYRIDKGKLSADLHYVVENRKLDAQHKFVVSQLQLGERVDSPDATSLPVRLAIALLKDRDGVIRLDLPVSGNLDDPSFSIGPIVWKMVVHLVEKIITAPFALLGSLFGGGEEIASLAFAAGSAELDATARSRIATLAKGLDARPALNIDVPLTADAAVDRAAIRARRWQEQLEALATRRLAKKAAEPGAIAALLADPAGYRALLEEGYVTAFTQKPSIPPPPTGVAPGSPQATAAAVAGLEQALATRLVVDPAELEALGHARAAAVQSALLDGTGIDPGRVFVVNAPPAPPGAAAPLAEGPPVAAPGATVTMQLALH
jgi:hypothetical protein